MPTPHHINELLSAVLALALWDMVLRTTTNGHHHAKWHESPAQNVRKSQQYDYLVATNGSFRAYRMRKECGPIRDPELRASCVGSFGAYEPR